jgi:hypothetical protein
LGKGFGTVNRYSNVVLFEGILGAILIATGDFCRNNCEAIITMNRLNYFNPYDSKAGSYEDQLTRAYLVLLKHSCHAFFTFVEFARSEHKTTGKERPFTIIDFLEQGWDIETQKGNPVINTDYLLSILITDSHIATTDSSVQSSERNARYDGIITFGSSLTMVIENKPRSGNVWFGQLNPSRQNLADGTQVYSSPIVLEWKEIIKQLNHLLSLPTISGYEKTMIEDFLSYVDESFPYLNPYDSFHQCKGNTELINRRIHNLLKSISKEEALVKYHHGWGYYIQTPYQQIEEIGLILKHKENEYSLELSLYFGASQRQAIAFYNSKPKISELKNTKWHLFPNFHVSFMTSNLVWLDSDDGEHYLRFWQKNTDKIRQQKRADIPKYLKWLVDEKVINISKEAAEQLDVKFYKTAMQTLNICPEFGVVYSFNSSELESLDKGGKLKFLLAEKIREGLKVVGLDGKEILKKL